MGTANGSTDVANTDSCSAAASPWVERWLSGLPAGAKVLDLACGGGRHVHAALAHGLTVCAIDRDAAALAQLPEAVERLEFDLEQGAWPWADRRFDAIVVTNYLYRPLFDTLVAALGEGGILIYETFADGNARYGRPSNPDFLLRAGELRTKVAERLHVLAFEDGYAAAPRPARVQRVAALRMPAHDDAQAELLERFAL